MIDSDVFKSLTVFNLIKKNEFHKNIKNIIFDSFLHHKLFKI
ncbi:hypothetical protein CKA32_002926 [Geitlerinema sp. FC II]|nr:hypothetical protein CKA32_002926 [Geitlerinema sp. FC II]